MADDQPNTDGEVQADQSGMPELPDPASTLRLALGAIAIQAGTEALTRLVDRAVLGIDSAAQPDPQTGATKKPGKVKTLTSKKLAGIATKSVPGAAVIAGGLLVKYVFDRGGQRKQAQRDAHQKRLEHTNSE